MQARSSHVHLDMFRGGNLDFTPLAIAIVATDVIIGLYITERQVLPINIHAVIHIFYV